MKSNLRQPGNTTNISDDYPTHISRGSLGGDDLTDPYGTPVHAQLDNARVTIVDNSPDGSGGRYSRVTGPDGDSVESLHQSSVTAGRGVSVNADDVIGRSGASAYGSDWGTGGPHIHNHGVRASGARFSLEPYYWWLNGGTITAGSSGTPVSQSEEDILNDLNPATKQFITQTVHDQLNSLLVEDKPEIGQVSVVTRRNRAVNTARDAAIRATQNEGRYRLLRLKDGPQAGRIFARDMDTGRELEYRELKTLAQDIADDKNAELVGLDERIVEITQKQYDRQKSPFAALVAGK